MIIILQRLGSDHSHLFNSVDNIMKNYCERFLKLFSAYVFLQKRFSEFNIHPRREFYRLLGDRVSKNFRGW